MPVARRAQLAALSLPVIASLAGCGTLKVAALDPQRMVDIADPGASLSLALEPTVQGTFTIPEQSGIREVQVSAWHQTLTRGFGAAFGTSATVVDHDGAWVVSLKQAQLDFVPDAIYEGGGAAAVRARLRYLGRVTRTADGEVLARLSGEIVSEGVWSTSGGEASTSTEVVEKLFQQIGETLAKLPVEGGAGAAPADNTLGELKGDIAFPPVEDQMGDD
jgi:hypothetical protein